MAIDFDSQQANPDHASEHPALAAPPPPGSRSTGSGLDRIVFGVTAAIAVGFLVWGFVSTPSLSSVVRLGADLDDGEHRLAVRR